MASVTVHLFLVNTSGGLFAIDVLLLNKCVTKEQLIAMTGVKTSCIFCNCILIFNV